MEGLRIIKGLDLGLVEALSKLAPHGVEHEFSEGTQPWILLDLVVVQLDAFMLKVFLDVCFSSSVMLSLGHPLASCLIFNHVLT